MKRIMMILGIIITSPSYAATMCVANNNVAIVLDPNIAGTDYTYSAPNMTWKTVFPYGNIYGEALCSSTSGSYAGVGNPDETTAGDRKYCWCRSTHPLLSRWVFTFDVGSAGNCSSICAARCGDYVRLHAAFLSALFGSVAQ